MYEPDMAQHIKYRDLVSDVLLNKDLYVNEEQRLKFKKYYENEWKTTLHKWAGVFSKNIEHMGCRTTQRAESGHSALKKGMTSMQPLALSFNKVANYLDHFEKV
ncbi:hypothetical protein ABG067_008827, partial [Albugo candida]